MGGGPANRSPADTSCLPTIAARTSSSSFAARPATIGEMIGDRPGAPRPVASWMTSRRALLALALMLAGSWFWRTYLVEAPPSPISYSQFFAWLGDGKVQSVVMSG